MALLTLAERVDSLLDELDTINPASFDLGTPELTEVNAANELVSMGTAVVPQLLERVRGNVSKQRIAYIALVLNRLGDVRALGPLLDLRARYQESEPKDQWDYAVIGQCNLAIEQLQNKAR
jgi:hypothetical protein